MLTIVAAALTLSADVAPPTRPLHSAEARATIRILRSVRLRVGAERSEEGHPVRLVSIRSADGERHPARLVELE